MLNIPILRCWPLDGGRFITLPCVVTRDPDTGERNLGMYRIQIYDDKTTGMHWQLQKVAARHGRRYYEKGERMPVAIFIGGDPMFPFAATCESDSSIMTPGSTGAPGKCPWKNSSLTVTFLTATSRRPASCSVIASTSEDGCR